MAIVVRADKSKVVKTITQNNFKEEFLEGLVEEGFTYKEKENGDRCYTHANIDYIFIICLDKHYEIRCYSNNDYYTPVRRKEYRGKLTGLKLLYN